MACPNYFSGIVMLEGGGELNAATKKILTL